MKLSEKMSEDGDWIVMENITTGEIIAGLVGHGRKTRFCIFYAGNERTLLNFKDKNWRWSPAGNAFFLGE